MTNFENWQATIPEKDRVENVEALVIDHGPETDEAEFRYEMNIPCETCPCRDRCEKEHSFWRGCADIFQEWAKEETK